MPKFYCENTAISSAEELEMLGVKNNQIWQALGK